MENLIKITGKIQKISRKDFLKQGSQSNPFADIAVSKSEVEKILVSTGLTPEEIKTKLANATEGNFGAYVSFGGLSLVKDSKGEFSLIRIFTTTKHFEIGDNVEIQTSYAKAGDSYGEEGKKFEKDGFHLPKIFNTASGDRRRAEEDSIQREAAVNVATMKSLGINTNALAAAMLAKYGVKSTDLVASAANVDFEA